MKDGLLLWKQEFVELLGTSPQIKNIEVDFDMDMDEAIELYGVDLAIFLPANFPGAAGSGWIAGILSADPDKVLGTADYYKTPDNDDIWRVQLGEQLFGSSGGKSMNVNRVFRPPEALLLGRNLSICSTFTCTGFTTLYFFWQFWYKRIKPSAQDLNQLIARRR